ncbi:MAG: class II fructose-bisphosphatase [Alphaproteobacteria bacterium]|nr:class II fructose-bisphosphatase [Alphaproteobacteria bacterium]
MQDVTALERKLTLELVRVTEAAALASAQWVGKGHEKAADHAAVEAMRAALNGIDIDGTVVIGEGERDEAPMLFIGEKVGTGKGPKVDIALDPLEGTTLTAKAMPNALTVVAIAEGGSLLHAPDVYMDKIAIGGGYPAGTVHLDRPVKDNLESLAKAKGVRIKELGVCILDRERHLQLISDVREAGARVYLIPDGDIAGVIHCSDPATGIDMYVGQGGAPEGVLAAAALRCIGGQMEGRLYFRTDEERERAARAGIEDLDRVYAMEEMASGDVMFAATGVTNGSMLEGIHLKGSFVTSHSVVMRSKTRTVRWIKASHVRERKGH